jgi:plasmid maintenance system antidote protein VapI
MAEMTPEELDAFMKSRNWDAVALAARIPCTPAYIRLLLQGNRKMSAHMEARIRSLPRNARPVRHQHVNDGA